MSLKARYSSCSSGSADIPSSSASPHRHSQSTRRWLSEVPSSRIEGRLLPLSLSCSSRGRRSPNVSSGTHEESTAICKKSTVSSWCEPVSARSWSSVMEADMSAASSSSCSSIVGSRDHASKSSLSSMPSEATTAALVIQLNQRCEALFRMCPPQNSGNNFVLWKVRHARVPGCKKQKASI